MEDDGSSVEAGQPQPMRCGAAKRLMSTEGNLLVKRRFGRQVNHLEAYLWKDLFTSLVDAHWRRILALGASVYIGVWIAFALVYYIFMNDSSSACPKSEISTFADAFLLSIDTQTTIGFGNYAVDSDCTAGIYILVAQCLLSVLLDAAFMGLVFVKISRPQYRSKTVIFSRQACISDADGQKYLMIRVADQRKNQLVEAHARLLMYYIDDLTTASPPTSTEPCTPRGSYDCTPSNKLIYIEMKELSLVNKELFLALPCVIMHRIDPSSPLYNLDTPEALERKRVELILLLEGATASTSQTMQARRSYLPSEILWGREFAPCCHIFGGGPVQVDFDRVHETVLTCPIAVAAATRSAEEEAAAAAAEAEDCLGTTPKFGVELARRHCWEMRLSLT